MSWILNIAIVGVIAVGLWWWFSSMGSAQTPLGLAPPAGAEAEAGGVDSAGNPIPDTGAFGDIADKREDIRGQFEKQYGLSPTAECVAGSGVADGEDCECATVGDETAMICKNDDGTKCTKSRCTTGIKNLSDDAKDCNCTFPLVAKDYAAGGGEEEEKVDLSGHFIPLSLHIQHLPCTEVTVLE